jgi:hypothetical protein
MVASYPLTRLIQRGRWGEVRAVVCGNGKCWTVDFLLEEMDLIKLGHAPAVTTARDKCLEWFQVLADEGKLPPKRFRNEALSFLACAFEIGNKQIRFPCFRDGRQWIITHGFEKPGAKKKLGAWPPEQIDRADGLRKEYEYRKKLLGV